MIVHVKATYFRCKSTKFLAKLQNNAEIAKRFRKINARKPINKGNQGRNGEIR